MRKSLIELYDLKVHPASKVPESDTECYAVKLCERLDKQFISGSGLSASLEARMGWGCHVAAKSAPGRRKPLPFKLGVTSVNSEIFTLGTFRSWTSEFNCNCETNNSSTFPRLK